MKVSVGNSRMDKKWNLVDMSLEDFRARIFSTHKTAETMEQYRKLPKAQRDEIKDTKRSLGTTEGGMRAERRITPTSVLRFVKTAFRIAPTFRRCTERPSSFVPTSVVSMASQKKTSFATAKGTSSVSRLTMPMLCTGSLSMGSPWTPSVPM